MTINIGTEGTSNISRGHLTALGLTKESTEVILKSYRGSEDSRTLLLRGTVLALLLGAAAALASLLDLLGYTLLEALEGLDIGNGLIANLLVRGDKRSNFLFNSAHFNNSGFSDGTYNRGSSYSGHGGNGRLSLFGGLFSNYRGSSNRGGGGRSNFSFLGYTLGGGRGGRLVHCIITGGILGHL
jgi:hypothetical protein